MALEVLIKICLAFTIVFLVLESMVVVVVPMVVVVLPPPLSY